MGTQAMGPTGAFMSGNNGSHRIADTKTYHAGAGTDDGSNVYKESITGWNAFTVMVDAVFAAGTVAITGDIPNASDTFVAGKTYFFPLSKIQLTSGTIYAHARD